MPTWGQAQHPRSRLSNCLQFDDNCLDRPVVPARWTRPGTWGASLARSGPATTTDSTMQIPLRPLRKTVANGGSLFFLSAFGDVHGQFNDVQRCRGWVQPTLFSDWAARSTPRRMTETPPRRRPSGNTRRHRRVSRVCSRWRSCDRPHGTIHGVGSGAVPIHRAEW
jgi:hypothetical protein